MLLRKAIHKAKNFLNKSLQNLKFFLFGGYKKLTRSPSFNLLSSNLNDPKMQQLDNFYKEFCEQWESDGKNVNNKTKGSMRKDIESNQTMINKEDNGGITINTMEEQNSVVIISRLEEDVGCSKRHDLEEKMKELEMMDMNDEEHVLDIEEVLHYYSRLTSPIYQDLVDKFFTDMYSDFFLPRPSVKKDSVNGSIRRLGPLNI